MARDINIKIGATDTASAVLATVSKSVAGLNKSFSGLSSKLTSSGQSMVKAGGIATGVLGSALAGLVKSASDSEETMGKFKVVFGDASKAMEAWSDKSADALGVSEDAMAGMLSGMQDLLVPMGVVPDVAGEMSKTLSTLAVDLGSFNNMSSDKTFEDLQAAMTGSGEVMKKYGVILSEAAVKQELVNQGLDPKAATNAQKAQARLNIIMAGTTSAQGDAIRTSGSLANQIKRLGALASDVSGMIGDGLIETIKDMTGQLITGAKWIKDFVGENQRLIGAAGKVAIAITGIGIAATGIGAGLMFAGGAIAGLQTIAAVAAAGITAAFSPVIAIVGGVAIAGVALAGVFGVMAYKSGLLGEAVEEASGILESLGQVASETFNGITDAINAGEWGLAAQVGIAGVKLAIATGLEGIYQSFLNLIPKLTETLGEFFKWWVKAAADAAATVTKIITNPLSAAQTAFDFLQGNSLSFDVSMPNVGEMLRKNVLDAENELKVLSASAKRAYADVQAADFWSALAGETPGDALEVPMVKNFIEEVRKLPGSISSAFGGSKDTLQSQVSSMGSKLGLDFKDGFAEQITSLAGELANQLVISPTVEIQGQTLTTQQGKAERKTATDAKLERSNSMLSSIKDTMAKLGPVLSDALSDGLGMLSDFKFEPDQLGINKTPQNQNLEIEATQSRLLTGVRAGQSSSTDHQAQLKRSNDLLEKNQSILEIIAKHTERITTHDPIEFGVIV